MDLIDKLIRLADEDLDLVQNAIAQAAKNGTANLEHVVAEITAVQRSEALQKNFTGVMSDAVGRAETRS